MIRRIITLFVALVAAALLVGCTSPGTGGDDDDDNNDNNSTSTPTQGQAGYTQGQIAADWTLVDGSGADVNLWEFSGKVIYFEDGSEW